MQLGLVGADAAAGAAHGEGGADDDGIADLLGKGQSVVQILYHLAGDAGLAQLLHGVLEQLPVLGPVDGLGAGAQQTHTGLFQIAAAGQFHGQVQAGLTAQVGQDGVGMLDLDHPLHHLGGEGLHIDVVGHVRVGHDGCGVGVEQNGLNALCFQGAAGLGAGVVELGRLADDDGPGADHQNFFNGRIFWHRAHSPFFCAIRRMNSSNRYSASRGPPLASGWNWTVKQFQAV